MRSKRGLLRRALLVSSALVGLLVVAAIGVLATQPLVLLALCHARAPSLLVVPVAGLHPVDLVSTFGAPRPENRAHEGIDIFAARGTPVVAAATGRVFRVGQDRLGGNVVWVAGAGARLYYYAHLEHFRDGLLSGEEVSAGALLGYVGTTGNAKNTPPHLHFGVYPLATGFRAVDPAPLLGALDPAALEGAPPPRHIDPGRRPAARR